MHYFKRKISFIFLLFLVIPLPVVAQYKIGSLNYEKLYIYNPSYTTLNAHTVSLQHQRILPFYNVHINNYMVSYSLPLENIRSGIGVTLQNYNEGKNIYSSTRMIMNYAHKIQISRDVYLHGGISGAIWYNRFAKSKLALEDESEILMDDYYFMSNFSFGIALQWKNQILGISADNLIPKNIDNVTINSRFFGIEFIGNMPIYRFEYNNEPVLLCPLINFQYVNKNYYQFSYGSQVKLGDLTMAGTVSHVQNVSNADISFSFGYAFQKFVLGYTVSIWTGGERRSTLNTSSHEVTFLMKLKYKRNIKPYRKRF